MPLPHREHKRHEGQRSDCPCQRNKRLSHISLYMDNTARSINNIRQLIDRKALQCGRNEQETESTLSSRQSQLPSERLQWEEWFGGGKRGREVEQGE